MPGAIATRYAWGGRAAEMQGPWWGGNGFKCRISVDSVFSWGSLDSAKLEIDGMTTKHGAWCKHGDLSLKCLKLSRIW